MNKRVKFTVSDNLNVTEKIIEYFKQSGFKQLYKNEEKLIFKRGSIALNMWNGNPLKWKSKVEIEISGQEILADLEVNTTGHIPSKKDEKRWDSFISNFKQFLTEKHFDIEAENEKLTKNKFSDYIGWSAFIGFILGFSTRYITGLTGINWIVYILAVYGIYMLLTKVINDTKREKTPYMV